MSPVRVATTEFASLYSKLATSGTSESDGNPSVTDIRQQFVRYGLRFHERLPYKPQSAECLALNFLPSREFCPFGIRPALEKNS
jgi:hypothetical protein